MGTGYFVIIEKRPDTLAGTIHIGLRLNQQNLNAKGTPLAAETLHLPGLDLPTVQTGEVIDEKKTDVVPGEMILPTRITETDDQKSRIRHDRTR